MVILSLSEFLESKSKVFRNRSRSRESGSYFSPVLESEPESNSLMVEGGVGSRSGIFFNLGVGVGVVV